VRGKIVPGLYHVYGPVLLGSEDASNITVEDFGRFYNIMMNGVGVQAFRREGVDWDHLKELDNLYATKGDQFEDPIEDI
jgi:hypothetical protein